MRRQDLPDQPRQSQYSVESPSVQGLTFNVLLLFQFNHLRGFTEGLPGETLLCQIEEAQNRYWEPQGRMENKGISRSNVMWNGERFQHLHARPVECTDVPRRTWQRPCQINNRRQDHQDEKANMEIKGEHSEHVFGCFGQPDKD